MGRKVKSDGQFGRSARMNTFTYNYYYQRLKELSMSMFEWKNLPDTIDERFLELTLFNDGKAIFFKDDVLDYLALQCSISGELNVYRIPINRKAYATNGYQKFLNDKDSVIIYNNYIHENTAPVVEMFAQRLWDLDRSIDVNCKAQKTPIVITCNEEQRMTMLNLYQKYEGNEPFIFGGKNLDLSGVKTLNTQAPFVADRLQQLKNQIWNDALTYLGISNTNQTKKERLITDEIIRSMGGVIASRYSRLESRRQAVEQINKMFGLEIEVNYRADYREADDEVMFSGATGDGEMQDMVIDLRTN